ncbi:hypothetical protein L1887_61845 [Cichorium endivia]|nr:hypothetical protein L1887_61845 [Cichorium endivia]
MRWASGTSFASSRWYNRSADLYRIALNVHPSGITVVTSGPIISVIALKHARRFYMWDLNRTEQPRLRILSTARHDTIAFGLANIFEGLLSGLSILRLLHQISTSKRTTRLLHCIRHANESRTCLLMIAQGHQSPHLLVQSTKMKSHHPVRVKKRRQVRQAYPCSQSRSQPMIWPAYGMTRSECADSVFLQIVNRSAKLTADNLSAAMQFDSSPLYKAEALTCARLATIGHSCKLQQLIPERSSGLTSYPSKIARTEQKTKHGCIGHKVKFALQ